MNKGPFSLSALKILTMREAQKKPPPSQLRLPPLELPPPPAHPCDAGALRVGFLWTSTYDSEFANNLITMFETMVPMCVETEKGCGRPRSALAQRERQLEADASIQMWWFSVNDDGDDEAGEYKARKRARQVFGERFVVLQSGEQRPDHTGYHEGVDTAMQIRRHNLHMLFNLPGWLNEMTMSISGAQPAVMQVAFKGYPGTLGAQFVQHLISDAISSPPEYAAAGYTERMVYMPHTYYPVGNYATWKREGGNGSRGRDARSRGPGLQRKHYALPPSGTVYGAFNDHYKIDPSIFRTWMRILKDDVSAHANSSISSGEGGNPSVLWALKHGAEDMLPKVAKKYKVQSARLIFSSFFPKTQHLSIKALSDIFLDTPLYNAHSTASDMLWAQVPVLTLPREKMAGRAAASIVAAGGMGIGIARNEDDYRQLAPRLARSTRRLRQPGRALSREELARSYLFDEKVFAAAMLRCLRLLAEAHRLAVDVYRGRQFHILVAA